MSWRKSRPTKLCNAVFGFLCVLCGESFSGFCSKGKTFNTEGAENTGGTEKWSQKISNFKFEISNHESQVTNHGNPWAARFLHSGNWSTTPSRAGQNFAVRCAAKTRNISTACFAACVPTRK